MRQSVFCFDTLHLGGNLLQLQFQPLGGELAHCLLHCTERNYFTR